MQMINPLCNPCPAVGTLSARLVRTRIHVHKAGVDMDKVWLWRFVVNVLVYVSPITVAIFCQPLQAGSMQPLKEHEAMAHQLPDTGHLLPAYALWAVEMLCSNSRYRAETGERKVACAKRMMDLTQICNRRFQQKIPRNDSKRRNGRLKYKDFIAGYQGCLKKLSRSGGNSQKHILNR
jgi:hypothetical protein